MKISERYRRVSGEICLIGFVYPYAVSAWALSLYNCADGRGFGDYAGFASIKDLKFVAENDLAELFSGDQFTVRYMRIKRKPKQFHPERAQAYLYGTASVELEGFCTEDAEEETTYAAYIVGHLTDAEFERQILAIVGSPPKPHTTP